jgi:hypothetical protein
MVIFWRDPRFHTGSPHMVMGTGNFDGLFRALQSRVTPQNLGDSTPPHHTYRSHPKNRQPNALIARNLADQQGRRRDSSTSSQERSRRERSRRRRTDTALGGQDDDDRDEGDEEDEEDDDNGHRRDDPGIDVRRPAVAGSTPRPSFRPPRPSRDVAGGGHSRCCVVATDAADADTDAALTHLSLKICAARGGEFDDVGAAAAEDAGVGRRQVVIDDDDEAVAASSSSSSSAVVVWHRPSRCSSRFPWRSSSPLSMPYDEAAELAAHAESDGLVCRVAPFCEGGDRAWQARDARGRECRCLVNKDSSMMKKL